MRCSAVLSGATQAAHGELGSSDYDADYPRRRVGVGRRWRGGGGQWTLSNN